MAPLQRPTLTPHPASLRRRVWPPRHRKIKARGGHTASFPWCVLRQHGGTAGCRVQRPPRQRIIQNRGPRGTRGAANLIPARPGTGSPGLHGCCRRCPPPRLAPAARTQLGRRAGGEQGKGGRCIAPPPSAGGVQPPPIATGTDERGARAGLIASHAAMKLPAPREFWRRHATASVRRHRTPLHLLFNRASTSRDLHSKPNTRS